MYQKTHTLPIGKLLQTAGLISESQLEQALLLQSEYTSMKLGEILALQEIIETQTVTFFVDKWEEIKQEGQQFPIGYYLTKASLLNEQQVQTILSEQKENKLKFGDLAVQKGWLKRNTVNFFLDAFSVRPPKFMSLIDLEQYDKEHLNLERKYADSSLILSRVLAWTGGNAVLTKSICRVFTDAKFNVPTGMEVTAVDKLIEGSLIRNWQNSQLGTYIRSIKENLLNNSKSQPLLLLKEYQSILLSGNKQNETTAEQQELLNLGLIVCDGEQLRVTNIIYQQIFNQDWLIESIDRLESQIQPETTTSTIVVNPNNANSSLTIESLELDTSINNDSLVKTTVDNKLEPVLSEAPLSQDSKQKKAGDIEVNISKDRTANEQNVLSPLTKFISLFTLAGFVLMIPFVVAINNYYNSLRQEQQKSFNPQSIANDLEQFCSEINLIDPPSSLNIIYRLERNKKEILSDEFNNPQQFPDNCETALDRLRILAAPQLGRESRVVEAIKNLCKISAESESIVEAGIWLEHWYNSDSWGKETKSYLKFVDDCPASKLVS